VLYGQGGAGHFSTAVLAPLSWRWDISAPAVKAPDVSALALYATAAANGTPLTSYDGGGGGGGGAVGCRHM